MSRGKGFHATCDSYYHREKGTEKTYGGIAANTSKVKLLRKCSFGSSVRDEPKEYLRRMLVEGTIKH